MVRARPSSCVGTMPQEKLSLNFSRHIWGLNKAGLRAGEVGIYLLISSPLVEVVLATIKP